MVMGKFSKAAIALFEANGTPLDEHASDAPPALKDMAFREIMSRADKTQPGSRLRRMPVDNLLAAVHRANARVIECDGDKMREEVTYATRTREYTDAMAAHDAALDEAKTQRAGAQAELFRVIAEHGGFEGVSDITELMRSHSGLHAQAEAGE